MLTDKKLDIENTDCFLGLRNTKGNTCTMYLHLMKWKRICIGQIASLTWEFHSNEWYWRCFINSQNTVS